jgi:PhnB protein
MSITKTSAPQPIPLVVFNGNCEEAMRYYEKVLGGTISVMIKAGESPIAEHMPSDFQDKILNAQLTLPGGGQLYAGDCPSHVPYEGIKGFHLSLNFDAVEDGEEIFNLLAEGGQVNMPYGPAFWAEKFGMVTDKYGVSWAVNGDLKIK